VDLVIWESIEEFWSELMKSGNNFHLLTTKTNHLYYKKSYIKGDYLIFGSETRGLPQSLLDENKINCATIPMDTEHVRSLNLATSAGIVIYEGLRQVTE